MSQATTPAPSALAFDSSSSTLNDGFEWATNRALQWVQTGKEGVTLPCYWAGLTDRPMFYSRDVAHQALGAHLLGLDDENFAMIRHFARSATQRRKWYPLWAFTFDAEPASIDYNSDDEFVREIPAVFELAQIALEQSRWTGDERWLTDPDLDTFIHRSLSDFVSLHDIRGNGVAGESGAGNIFAGSPTYNEAQTTPDIEVAADGIASQWAAFNAYANIAGNAERASYQAEADRLSSIFEAEWWDEDLGRYVTGFDTRGPILTNGYEAAWFPAVKGLIRSETRARRHLDYLRAVLKQARPRNIEAITYFPEAFLSYNEDEDAREWIEFLLDSRDDYPEVSYTAVAHLTIGLTGVAPLDDGGVKTRSHIRANEWIEARNIRVGRAEISVRHVGTASTDLTVHSAPHPVRWHAIVGGEERILHVPAGTTAHLAGN